MGVVLYEFLGGLCALFLGDTPRNSLARWSVVRSPPPMAQVSSSGRGGMDPLCVDGFWAPLACQALAEHWRYSRQARWTGREINKQAMKGLFFCGPVIKTPPSCAGPGKQPRREPRSQMPPGVSKKKKNCKKSEANRGRKAAGRREGVGWQVWRVSCSQSPWLSAALRL